MRSLVKCPKCQHADVELFWSGEPGDVWPEDVRQSCDCILSAEDEIKLFDRLEEWQNLEEPT